MREIKDKAIIFGFNSKGLIAYSRILNIHEYYDGHQVWDSWEEIKLLGIVRLVGILFMGEDISQEWENTYDERTGVITGSRNYSHREHLKGDAKYQAMIARFQELQARRGHLSSIQTAEPQR